MYVRNKTVETPTFFRSTLKIYVRSCSADRSRSPSKIINSFNVYYLYSQVFIFNQLEFLLPGTIA